MKEENIDWSLLSATESLKTIDQTEVAEQLLQAL